MVSLIANVHIHMLGGWWWLIIVPRPRFHASCHSSTSCTCNPREEGTIVPMGFKLVSLNSFIVWKVTVDVLKPWFWPHVKYIQLLDICQSTRPMKFYQYKGLDKNDTDHYIMFSQLYIGMFCIIFILSVKINIDVIILRIYYIFQMF